MRTFEQLSGAQQRHAIDRCLRDLLEAICEGAIRFDDSRNGDNLQARIDAAAEKADAMRTPWFTAEYILDTCRADLDDMARCAAEDSLYAEADERVIHGIAA